MDMLEKGLWEYLQERNPKALPFDRKAKLREKSAGGFFFGDDEESQIDEFYFKQYIGEKIQEERKAYGMTQEALREKAGISRNRMIDIEKGRTDIKVIELYQVAKALNCSVMDFWPMEEHLGLQKNAIPQEIRLAIINLAEWIEKNEGMIE